MRKTQLKAEEFAELDETKRIETRKSGFDLMLVRDKGWGRLKDGTVVEWRTKRLLQNGEAKRYIPEGYIIINDQLYNVEELNRFIRWA